MRLWITRERFGPICPVNPMTDMTSSIRSSSNSVSAGSSAFLMTGSSIASISEKYFLTTVSRSQMLRITFQHLNMITFFFSAIVGVTISS